MIKKLIVCALALLLSGCCTAHETGRGVVLERDDNGAILVLLDDGTYKVVYFGTQFCHLHDRVRILTQPDGFTVAERIQ